MKYHFKIRKEKRGYSAVCLEFEGCITQADSKEELDENMREALNLYLDEPEDSKLVFPFPRKQLRGSRIVEVPVSPRVAFAAFLRRTRLEKHLTQRRAMELIGMTGSL